VCLTAEPFLLLAYVIRQHVKVCLNSDGK
jgi:hypothetical protein